MANRDSVYKQAYLKAKRNELTDLSIYQNSIEQTPKIEEKAELQKKPKINRTFGYGGRFGGMRI